MTLNHLGHPLWVYFVAWAKEKNIPLNKGFESHWETFLAGVRAKLSYERDVVQAKWEDLPELLPLQW